MNAPANLRSGEFPAPSQVPEHAWISQTLDGAERVDVAIVADGLVYRRRLNAGGSARYWYASRVDARDWWPLSADGSPWGVQ